MSAGYPAELKTAEDVAGVLRRFHDNLTDKAPFRFKMIVKLLDDILCDYPDPYEAVIVLARAAEDGKVDFGGDVWNTLDLRAYGRLRGSLSLPEGMARYFYIYEFIADKRLRAELYFHLAAWEDADEVGDDLAIAAAKAELDKLLNQPRIGEYR